MNLSALLKSAPPDWPRFLAAMVLVMIRLSGLMLFAPVFSSEAIPVRVKTVFVLITSLLLAPMVAALPLAHAELGLPSIAGELSIGLVFGFALTMFSEILIFAGQVLGFQFSFSLVNLLDPNAPLQTPLLSQMFTLLGTLVLLGSGLYRDVLLALLRSFHEAPVGAVWLSGPAALTLVGMLSGVFFAALQLAAPVVAATLLVEVAVSVLGKLSPQLPVMMVAIPAKTLLGYTVLLGSLALWPRFLEGRFSLFLDRGELLMRHAMRLP
ncbi:flagellar biosynthetic protein FliR [Silvibacterium bohemicum]|uniref:Flagellar biosynthetic protein FliR n=1 Tax=Silvibacterium bohemicum TaxID=1577686 RepID=A0A841K0X2_9BACT|nr:flagellar biosynthetic protein FliR [Silvibacterium bohemicum]MBB6147232.1 flagellar biosynthetic protein FliR [Silvibacterium bohemicum]